MYGIYPKKIIEIQRNTVIVTNIYLWLHSVTHTYLLIIPSQIHKVTVWWKHRETQDYPGIMKVRSLNFDFKWANLDNGNLRKLVEPAGKKFLRLEYVPFLDQPAMIVSLSHLTSLEISLFVSKAPSSSNILWCCEDPLEKQPTRVISQSIDLWNKQCDQCSYISRRISSNLISKLSQNQAL